MRLLPIHGTATLNFSIFRNAFFLNEPGKLEYHSAPAPLISLFSNFIIAILSQNLFDSQCPKIQSLINLY